MKPRLRGSQDLRYVNEVESVTPFNEVTFQYEIRMCIKSGRSLWVAVESNSSF